MKCKTGKKAWERLRRNNKGSGETHMDDNSLNYWYKDFTAFTKRKTRGKPFPLTPRF